MIYNIDRMLEDDEAVVSGGGIICPGSEG